MDIKGIRWVGNIYQKFEAMCLEVEEAMCQDLRSPSSNDLSRVASHDLSVNPYLEFGIHKKPISSINVDPIDHVCIKGISVKKSNSTNDVWEDWSAASFNCEISDNDEENCDRIDVQASNEATVCESSGQQELQMSNLTVYTSFASSPPGTELFTKSSTDPCENNRMVSFSQPHSDISTNTHCGQPAGNEVFSSHTAEFDPDLKDEKENDTTVKSIEPIEHESETGFEETCVLVNGNDYRPDNHKQEIKRSYKKKIQSAFSLKKKSSKKQEYKQLAAQYDKLITEIDIQSNKLATNDSIESEWELL